MTRIRKLAGAGALALTVALVAVACSSNSSSSSNGSSGAFQGVGLTGAGFACCRLRAYALMPSSLAAVPPRIAVLSSSLRPGVLRIKSTAVLVHG